MPIPVVPSLSNTNPSSNQPQIIQITWPAAIGVTGWTADLTKHMNVGKQARLGPGTKQYSGAEIEIVNDCDVAFGVSFDNSSASVPIIPGTVHSIKVPMGAQKLLGLSLYQNPFQAHPTEVIAVTFYDENDIEAGFKPRSGSINFNTPAATIGPGTLPVGVIIPANQVSPGASHQFQNSNYIFPNTLTVLGGSLALGMPNANSFFLISATGGNTGDGIVFQVGTLATNVFSLGGQFSGSLAWIDTFGILNSAGLISSGSISLDTGAIQSDGAGNVTMTTLTAAGIDLSAGSSVNDSTIFNNNGFRNRAIQMNAQQIAATPTHICFTSWDGTTGHSCFGVGSNSLGDTPTWIDDAGHPFISAVPTLATGNQETMFATGRGQGAAGGDVWGFPVGFRTHMTNTPSSITLTSSVVINCTASVGTITKDGFVLLLTVTAGGSFSWIGTGTTVGN